MILSLEENTVFCPGYKAMTALYYVLNASRGLIFKDRKKSGSPEDKLFYYYVRQFLIVMRGSQQR